MAITVPAFSITMSDADYQFLNAGVAASGSLLSPTGAIQPSSLFYGIGLVMGARGFQLVDEPSIITATSNGAGAVTTVAFTAGNSTEFNIRMLLERLRRVKELQLTYGSSNTALIVNYS